MCCRVVIIFDQLTNEKESSSIKNYQKCILDNDKLLLRIS